MVRFSHDISSYIGSSKFLALTNWEWLGYTDVCNYSIILNIKFVIYLISLSFRFLG